MTYFPSSTALDKGLRACHPIRLIGVERVDFPSPTTQDKGLKPLAPTIRQRWNQGFGDLMTAPKSIQFKSIQFKPIRGLETGCCGP